MAYTPINWQTGQTITAEKLNKMDNGWSIENTQLFSDTVTTAEDESNFISGILTYTSAIDADTINILFDSVAYECNRIDAFDGYYYGGFGEQGPDFTEFPFLIVSGPIDGENIIYTETAGTYTVSVNVPSVEISPNFETASIAATASTIDAALPYLVEIDETPLSDIYSAIRSGRLPIIVAESAQSNTPAYFELVMYARPYNRTVRSIRIADDGSRVVVVEYTADSADGPIYPTD